jgi:hypothetical protein
MLVFKQLFTFFISVPFHYPHKMFMKLTTGWLLLPEHDDRHVDQGPEGVQGRRVGAEADDDVCRPSHHGQVESPALVNRIGHSFGCYDNQYGDTQNIGNKHSQ